MTITQPNSCLYEATAIVVKEQFGVDISGRRSVFDRYNKGNGSRGVDFRDMAYCINEALYHLDICVVEIVGNIEGEFPHRPLVKPPHFVPTPCLSFSTYDDGVGHMIAVTGDMRSSSNAVFVLGSRQSPPVSADADGEEAA